MMPGWRVHRYLDITYFGKSYSKIHRKMDEPVFFLGRGHRILFHDLPSAITFAEECYPGDPNAVEAACLHILTDKLCTADPFYKKNLEMLELLDRPKKKKHKKKKNIKSKDPFFLKLQKDLKHLRKLQRLLSAGYA